MVSAAFAGLAPAVVAIVSHAVCGVGTRALNHPVPVGFAVAAFVALAVFGVPFPVVMQVLPALTTDPADVVAAAAPTTSKGSWPNGSTPRSGRGDARTTDQHTVPAHHRSDHLRVTCR